MFKPRKTRNSLEEIRAVEFRILRRVTRTNGHGRIHAAQFSRGEVWSLARTFELRREDKGKGKRISIYKYKPLGQFQLLFFVPPFVHWMPMLAANSPLFGFPLCPQLCVIIFHLVLVFTGKSLCPFRVLATLRSTSLSLRARNESSKRKLFFARVQRGGFFNY